MIRTTRELIDAVTNLVPDDEYFSIDCSYNRFSGHKPQVKFHVYAEKSGHSAEHRDPDSAFESFKRDRAALEAGTRDRIEALDLHEVAP